MREPASPSIAVAGKGPVSLAPTWVDRALSAAALLLLLGVVAAICRGRDRWGTVPPAIWFHLATVAIALALTPIMLMRKRGDRLHRVLGWIWVVALVATALASFDIRIIRNGRLSLIHLISLFVLIQTPLIVWHARNHAIRRHRIAVRATTAGALLVAGLFTFPFGRLLGRWLFG